LGAQEKVTKALKSSLPTAIMKKAARFICCLSLILALTGTTFADQYVRLNLETNCVESSVQAVAPFDSLDDEKKERARQSALDELYAELTQYILGAWNEKNARTSESVKTSVKPEKSETKVDYKFTEYMGSKVKKHEVSKIVSKNVEVVKEEWDGEFYTVWGRLPLSKIYKTQGGTGGKKEKSSE
jgi:hypothetical protein